MTCEEGKPRRITLKPGERIIAIDMDSQNRQYIEVAKREKQTHN